MSDKPNILIVESSDKDEFGRVCNDLGEDGYIMRSCSCRFLNIEQYEFCSAYHAIFEKQEENKKKRGPTQRRLISFQMLTFWCKWNEGNSRCGFPPNKSGDCSKKRCRLFRQLEIV